MKSKQQYITVGIAFVTIVLSQSICADAPQGTLIIDEGFESGVLPFKASGNAPEVVEVPNTRAGKYVMKSM